MACMNKNMGTSLLMLSLLFSGLGASSASAAIRCDQVLASDSKFEFLSDHDYLQEKKNKEKVGIVRSIFSKKFDTRIYFTATGAPDANGVIPVVDPKAKALYIYLHGSGTNKASGVNFSYKMNKMATLGYALIGIDLPFHAEGSRSENTKDPQYFYALMDQMIKDYKVAGMPVYLVGHSFGPDVAAEFVQRYPFSVDGIAMISPAGFTEVLARWYREKTAKMAAFWDSTSANNEGAEWAGTISDRGTWSRKRTSKNPDPTLINPRLKIRILSGELEEYVPGELDERGLPTKKKRDYDLCVAIMKIFAKAKCQLEPNVGHYIFEHKDANGHDVILREMLELNDQSVFNEKQLKAEAKAAGPSEASELTLRYAREGSFKAYVDKNLGGYETIWKIAKEEDVKQARKITTEFNRFILPQRDRAMAENILNTKNWNPKFYEENKADIDAIDAKKMVASDRLIVRYTSLLESMTAVERAAHSMISEDVFVIPERVIPPAHLQDRMKKEDGQQFPAAA